MEPSTRLLFMLALEEINCNDFEENDGGFTHELISGRNQEGADDWMWNVPVGSGGDPDYAASGEKYGVTILVESTMVRCTTASIKMTSTIA